MADDANDDVAGAADAASVQSREELEATLAEYQTQLEQVRNLLVERERERTRKSQ